MEQRILRHQRLMDIARLQMERAFQELEGRADFIQSLTKSLGDLDCYLERKIDDACNGKAIYDHKSDDCFAQQVNSIKDSPEALAVDRDSQDSVPIAAVAKLPTIVTVHSIPGEEDCTTNEKDYATVSEKKITLSTSKTHIKVNFGGHIVALDLRVLQDPLIRPNFLTAILLHPRWHMVLPKDHHGNLYFEIEYDWIKPVFDAYELISSLRGTVPDLPPQTIEVQQQSESYDTAHNLITVETTPVKEDEDDLDDNGDDNEDSGDGDDDDNDKAEEVEETQYDSDNEEYNGLQSDHSPDEDASTEEDDEDDEDKLKRSPYLPNLDQFTEMLPKSSMVFASYLQAILSLRPALQGYNFSQLLTLINSHKTSFEGFCDLSIHQLLKEICYIGLMQKPTKLLSLQSENLESAIRTFKHKPLLFMGFDTINQYVIGLILSRQSFIEQENIPSSQTSIDQTESESQSEIEQGRYSYQCFVIAKINPGISKLHNMTEEEIASGYKLYRSAYYEGQYTTNYSPTSDGVNIGERLSVYQYGVEVYDEDMHRVIFKLYGDAYQGDGRSYRVARYPSLDSDFWVRNDDMEPVEEDDARRKNRYDSYPMTKSSLHPIQLNSTDSDDVGHQEDDEELKERLQQEEHQYRERSDRKGCDSYPSFFSFKQYDVQQSYQDAWKGIITYTNRLWKYCSFKQLEVNFILSLLTARGMYSVDCVHYFRNDHREGSTLLDITPTLRQRYDEIASYASRSKQDAMTKDIVWFSVRGESVCLLRSTIVEVIPNSQLAVRVSGDWKEQSNTRDDEGRIIINFPMQIFLPFVEHIRACKMFGITSKMIGYPTRELTQCANHMLQYFAIKEFCAVCTSVK